MKATFRVFVDLTDEEIDGLTYYNGRWTRSPSCVLSKDPFLNPLKELIKIDSRTTPDEPPTLAILTISDVEFNPAEAEFVFDDRIARAIMQSDESECDVDVEDRFSMPTLVVYIGLPPDRSLNCYRRYALRLNPGVYGDQTAFVSYEGKNGGRYRIEVHLGYKNGNLQERFKAASDLAMLVASGEAHELPPNHVVWDESD